MHAALLVYPVYLALHVRTRTVARHGDWVTHEDEDPLSAAASSDNMDERPVQKGEAVPSLKFEQRKYLLKVARCQFGLLGQLKAVSTVPGPIVYGISSDDVKINQIFRMGPETGLLYADQKLYDATRYTFNATADHMGAPILHADASVTVMVNRIARATPSRYYRRVVDRTRPRRIYSRSECGGWRP